MTGRIGFLVAGYFVALNEKLADAGAGRRIGFLVAGYFVGLQSGAEIVS